MYNIDLITGLPHIRKADLSTAAPTAVPIRALKERTGESILINSRITLISLVTQPFFALIARLSANITCTDSPNCLDCYKTTYSWLVKYRIRMGY